MTLPLTGYGMSQRRIRSSHQILFATGWCSRCCSPRWPPRGSPAATGRTADSRLPGLRSPPVRVLASGLWSHRPSGQNLSPRTVACRHGV